jgi:MFS family permease
MLLSGRPEAAEDARLTPGEWRALAAVWLGFGFDIFDALLINFVAPHAIPTLLGLPLGSAAAKAATSQWIGILTALLLVGWAIGGLLFGHLADRIGRRRALMLTIAVYALGTGASAFAPSLAVLVACRVVASLGIGGEFATGATLIAETVPERHRMFAGAFLQTASPLGLVLATLVNWWVAGVWMPDAPSESWRWVLATGLAPILLVLLLRSGAEVRDAPRASGPARGLVGSLALLFSPALRAATLSAVGMSVLGLFAWWSCNAFLPTIGYGLGMQEANRAGLDGAAAITLAESWKAMAANWFNAGGTLGALLTVPVARRLGRRGMFAVYYGVGALALLLAFAPGWSPVVTLRLTFLIGLAIYGLFGAFAFYLPELFPPHVRGLGSGFSFNIGRMGAAIGPFLVGAYSARQADPTAGAITALTWIALLPATAALLTPFIVETRSRIPERG